MARWFEGPAEPMCDANCQQVLSGQRTGEELDRPLGLGVPAGVDRQDAARCLSAAHDLAFLPP